MKTLTVKNLITILEECVRRGAGQAEVCVVYEGGCFSDAAYVTLNADLSGCFINDDSCKDRADAVKAPK
jgi:hypothetical protein